MSELYVYRLIDVPCVNDPNVDWLYYFKNKVNSDGTFTLLNDNCVISRNMARRLFVIKKSPFDFEKHDDKIKDITNMINNLDKIKNNLLTKKQTIFALYGNENKILKTKNNKNWYYSK